MLHAISSVDLLLMLKLGESLYFILWDFELSYDLCLIYELIIFLDINPLRYLDTYQYFI